MVDHTDRNAEIIDEWDRGWGWIADPSETIRRASHALSINGEVWLLDPVDFDGLDELLANSGRVAGIVIQLDRHKRDADRIAQRHDVPIYIHEIMDSIATAFDAEVNQFAETLPGTGFEAIPLVNNRFWREIALFNDNTDTLIIPETVGTLEFFCVGSERLGVSPVLRFFPPKQQLMGLDPNRVLVGHGEGILTDASTALSQALQYSRRNAPRLYLKLVKNFIG
ncbi:MAG: hypothetical protein ABEI86_04525 [Halobacteriaceae archaeon]